MEVLLLLCLKEVREWNDPFYVIFLTMFITCIYEKETTTWLWIIDPLIEFYYFLCVCHWLSMTQRERTPRQKRNDRPDVYFQPQVIKARHGEMKTSILCSAASRRVLELFIKPRLFSSKLQRACRGPPRTSPRAWQLCALTYVPRINE